MTRNEKDRGLGCMFLVGLLLTAFGVGMIWSVGAAILGVGAVLLVLAIACACVD